MSPIRDTSSLLIDGPGIEGDKVTPGVVKELIRLGQYPLIGLAEVYALPGTVGISLTYMTLRAFARIIGVKPSNVDLELMVASAVTGIPLKSKDSDINLTMARYYAQLCQRMAYGHVAWYYLAQAASIGSDKYLPAISVIKHLLGG